MTPGWPAWRKSSRSRDQNCVEAAPLGRYWVVVRDSSDPHGPRILLTRERWRELVIRLKGAA